MSRAYDRSEVTGDLVYLESIGVIRDLQVYRSPSDPEASEWFVMDHPVLGAARRMSMSEDEARLFVLGWEAAERLARQKRDALASSQSATEKGSAA